jgi:uncharacterized membrane protein YfcA
VSDVLTVLLVVAATFGTAALSAVAGFGGGALLLPVFVAVCGPRDAVAVLTVAQLAFIGSRAWFNRYEVDAWSAPSPSGPCPPPRLGPCCSRPRRCPRSPA